MDAWHTVVCDCMQEEDACGNDPQGSDCDEAFEECAFWYDRYDYNPPHSCES